MIDQWIATYRYIYNKTNEYIKSGHPANFQNLRNILVTRKHKDGTINENVSDWELNTPKDIRAAAVKECCQNYSTNFKKKKKFEMKYKTKKSNRQTINLEKACFSIKKGELFVYPDFMEESIGVIDKPLHKSKLIREYGKYWLYIPIDKEQEEQPNHIKNKTDIRICGIDPGLRTFMTIYSPNSIREVNTQNKRIRLREENGIIKYKSGNLIDKLNAQIDSIKSRNDEKYRIQTINKLNRQTLDPEINIHDKVEIEDRIEKLQNTRFRIRKLALRKRELKKSNLIDELHWKTITYIHKRYDCICYGDIKSHNIVKNGNNSINNRAFNDYKFYKFKCRLIYKSQRNNKKLELVNEYMTSKTCSSCGKINDIGINKHYTCSCGLSCDRDANSAKNMYIKGLIGKYM